MGYNKGLLVVSLHEFKNCIRICIHMVLKKNLTPRSITEVVFYLGSHRLGTQNHDTQGLRMGTHSWHSQCPTAQVSQCAHGHVTHGFVLQVTVDRCESLCCFFMVNGLWVELKYAMVENTRVVSTHVPTSPTFLHQLPKYKCRWSVGCSVRLPLHML